MVLTVNQSPPPDEKVGLKGKFVLEHWRGGKKLAEYPFFNAITDVGMNKLLDVMFGAVTQITTWYFGLVNSSGFSAFAAADTAASHSGWTELTTYSEGVRQTWVVTAASARAVTNPVTVATFTISGACVAKGAFLISNSTKSGTTGTLFSEAAFAADVTLANADTLKITYTVSG